jgi:hypothetical protein
LGLNSVACAIRRSVIHQRCFNLQVAQSGLAEQATEAFQGKIPPVVAGEQHRDTAE